MEFSEELGVPRSRDKGLEPGDESPDLTGLIGYLKEGFSFSWLVNLRVERDASALEILFAGSNCIYDSSEAGCTPS